MSNEQTSPRLTPVLPDAWDDAALDALSAFPTGRDFTIKNSRPGAPARGAHALGVLVQYPAAAKAFLTFNNHVATNSTLSRRIRELLIMRIGWLRCSEYEYQQHVVLARNAGISEEDILRVQAGADAPGWDPIEAELVRAVDELHRDARIDDATWTRLSAHFTVQEIMDMIFCVGCYDVLAMVLKSLHVPFEPGSESLDAATAARMHAQGGSPR